MVLSCVSDSEGQDCKPSFEVWDERTKEMERKQRKIVLKETSDKRDS